MADKAGMSHRDSVLISVLERLSDQLLRQDQLLEDIVNHQRELAKAVETAELHLNARQVGADEASGKLSESITRYRSDMLSLVNEQDHINKNIAGLNELINKTVYALEKVNLNFEQLEQRVKAQEKTLAGHFAHSLKQAETLPVEIGESTRSITKLHMDTEKNLGEMHRETQRQLEKLRQETTRRLLVLGDIESALSTLLIRTERPEKKPSWLIRLLRRAAGFFRAKLSRLKKNKQPGRKEE